MYIVPFPFDINTRFEPLGDIDGPILDAVVANDDVPDNEPVNEVAVTLVVTDKEFKTASDPDTINFFQLGILF